MPTIQAGAWRQITIALTSTKVSNYRVEQEIHPWYNKPDQKTDVRQCLIYDKHDRNARLIGIEYMITSRLYKTLPEEERKLWHSHVFEVKSGLLIMPTPAAVPTAAWEIAEQKEMEDVIDLYGKTYHFWEVDRGDTLPMGQPKLMMSLTSESDVNAATKEAWANRDKRFGVSTEKKSGQREYIQKPEIHPGKATL